LALEETLERMIPALGPDGAIEQGLSLQREDIIVQYRPEPALRLLVILDTSLSMDGPHRAMAALIGAVLTRETPSGCLALMAFHSKPQLIIRFGEQVKPLEAAYRVLRTPVGGITNISAALEYGLHILAASGNRQAHAVLITDGERTAGTDPCGPAKSFRKLHVVLVGQGNTILTKEMARVGKGFWRQVDRLGNVPATLLWLMQRLRTA
jgi:Mg-chelatase subunit ChlD